MYCRNSFFNTNSADPYLTPHSAASGFALFDNYPFGGFQTKLEAQVGQKSVTWIRLIMICYTGPWWPSWLYHIKLAIQNLICLKSFKIVTMATILVIGTERFSNSESLCHPDASHQVSAQSDVLFWEKI